jgi:hypothetical protein
MRTLVFCSWLCVILSSAAFAQQTNFDSRDGVPQRSLPSPDLPDSSKPSDYLRAAQGALASNHPREAEEALERAQTRMLDRSVPLGETGNPSDNPTSVLIAQARQALTARDRANCMNLLQQALTSATAQGL